MDRSSHAKYLTFVGAGFKEATFRLHYTWRVSSSARRSKLPASSAKCGRVETGAGEHEVVFGFGQVFTGLCTFGVPVLHFRANGAGWHRPDYRCSAQP